MTLSQIYSNLRSTGALPEDIFEEWLWKTDPEEKFDKDVLMNRCQLLGLLVCLYKALEEHQADPLGVDSRLSIMDKPVEAMSLTELNDTIANIQCEWPAFLARLPANPNAQENLDGVVRLIDRCVARFGHLCTLAGGVEVMDDLCSVEKSHDGLLQLTRAYMRRTICTFHVLYRHIHLLAMAETAPDQYYDVGITKYHVEASSDLFNTLCMYLTLPVAATINYKMDYAGLFNHISQPTFLHNPNYQRKPRQELAKFDSAPPEHILPAVCEMYPDIPIKYEEDRIDLAPGQGHFWIVIAGRIYLVDPEGRVHYSPSVTSLVQNVLLKKR